MSGIRNHDPGFRTSEDSACLRPLRYRDRLFTYLFIYFISFDAFVDMTKQIGYLV
jgi:hypothetical protein